MWSGHFNFRSFFRSFFLIFGVQKIGEFFYGALETTLGTDLPGLSVERI